MHPGIHLIPGGAFFCCFWVLREQKPAWATHGVMVIAGEDAGTLAGAAAELGFAWIFGRYTSFAWYSLRVSVASGVKLSYRLRIGHEILQRPAE